VAVLANHLPDWQLDHEHERQVQAVAAARALERLRDRHAGHVIVAGDLDADAANGADWDWPFRRIDYILVRCGLHGGPTLEIAGCARTFDQPRTIVSDHFGLVADLELPRSRTKQESGARSQTDSP
jgi:endonuclease/exonuclease/phosphatase family metal-dependent hydrolase